MDSRRTFVKKVAAGSVGVSLGLTAKSYSQVLGANDRINAAVMGTKGRGHALAESFSQAENCQVSHVCDVDSSVMARTVEMVNEIQPKKATAEPDFRKALEDKDLDVLVIAAPDHWHAPASILAMQAGKHVYLEKPCSHNPAEGEMLIAAQKKYDRLLQMGNQQRSGGYAAQAIQDLKDGLVGEVYHAKCWYSNVRQSIGTGKPVPVPPELDFELWQGPAPREEYRDNIIHYNWHWFKNWGTGEICNNGTHSVDVARWMLMLDYPTKVSSIGGRYHFKDDWQFPDTQTTVWEFDQDKTITLQSLSCNGMPTHGKSTGTLVQGTEGSFILNYDLYRRFDLKGKMLKEMESFTSHTSTDLIGGSGGLTEMHVANFLNGIREGEELTSPVEEAHKSVLLCHLGNIAQQVGRTLEINPQNGHILDDPEAEKLWGREYEPGWKPDVS